MRSRRRPAWWPPTRARASACLLPTAATYVVGRRHHDRLYDCRLRPGRGWHDRREPQRQLLGAERCTGNVVFGGGGFGKTTAIAATGTSVPGLDISSVAGANAALASIDAALQRSTRAVLRSVRSRTASPRRSRTCKIRLRTLGLSQPHPGHQLRSGNGEPVAGPGVAASWYGDGGASQPDAARSAQAPPVRRLRQRRSDNSAAAVS